MRLREAAGVPEERDPYAVIGLDIGGTKTAGGVVAFPGARLVSRRQIATQPGRGGLDVLERVLEFAGQLGEEAVSLGLQVRGVGAGVAELVDLAGEVRSSQTIAWSGVPVRERLSTIAPAVVESDVRAAALGEAVCGAGRSYRSFVYVTAGTGISSAFVLDGQPWTGARGNALVLATGPQTAHCVECAGLSSSVLEEYASGPAIARRYGNLTGASITKAEEVCARAAAGEAAAMEVVTSAATALGSAVGFLANVLDPEAVVVGGGLGLCGGLFWKELVASARRHIWARETQALPIVTAELGADCGVIGAAVRCRQELSFDEENLACRISSRV
ncbi:MAG: ROK family protein [Bryobacteraceae bacterium]|nr:ROK family protein [Bryobacteraceae bacterium]